MAKPSTAKVRDFAYLSPVFLASLYAVETSCNIGGSNSRADVRSRTCRSISVPKGCWLLPARLQAERNS